MRISVVGTSGAGKTTLARRVATAIDLPCIELDAINWQPGWRALNIDDLGEFRRRVDEAIAAEHWVCDGNYGSDVGDRVWRRATHIVWLDYGRSVIMPRVIGRSLMRALQGRELWPGTGNRETFRRWLDRGHPIRWAWDTWARRRTRYEGLIADVDAAHLSVFRLRHPGETTALIKRLRAERL